MIGSRCALPSQEACDNIVNTECNDQQLCACQENLLPNADNTICVCPAGETFNRTTGRCETGNIYHLKIEMRLIKMVPGEHQLNSRKFKFNGKYHNNNIKIPI